MAKLKGHENYGNWSFAVENYCILEGIYKCVKEVIEKENATAKAKIIFTIDPSFMLID